MPKKQILLFLYSNCKHIYILKTMFRKLIKKSTLSFALTGVVIIGIISFATFFYFGGLGLLTTSTARASVNYTADTIINLVNQERQNAGLSAVSKSDLLLSSSDSKAWDMANKQYFAHTSPEGQTPWQVIKNTGYKYSFAGENIAFGFSDENQLMSAWMNSPGHRANILRPSFTQMGVGISTGCYKGYCNQPFIVQHFATPRN